MYCDILWNWDTFLMLTQHLIIPWLLWEWLRTRAVLLCHWLNLNLSTATKELENPEDTAEKVGISALIIQVGYYKRCLVFFI